MAGETKPAQWFHGRGSVRKGPYPAAELSQLIATGAVLPTDLVWRAGFIDWAVVSSVAELNTPPSPPPSETKLVQWFYGRNGVQKGPFTHSEMAAMATAGTVLPTDLVWRHGFGEWLPASSVAELMGLGAVPASLPDGPHWYYGRDSARQGPFSETQMRDLATAGTLTEMDWVWREGLPEWAAARRFPELFGTREAAQGPDAITFRDARWLTHGLIGLLIAGMLFETAASILGFRHHSLVSGLVAQTGLSKSSFDAAIASSESSLPIISLIELPVLMATVIVFCIWIYRANANARQLGAKGMVFTPGWSVGWYFVPIANLWRPFQAMVEIWKASKNPADWPGLRGGAILPWWWLFFIAGNGVSRFADRLAFKSDTPDEVLYAAKWAIASHLTAIPASFLAIVLVRQIYGFQRASRHSQASQSLTESAIGV